VTDWLDLELAEELRPIAAPDELWVRVRAGVLANTARNGRPHPAARRKGPPVGSRSWASWPIAAIVTLMIAAATIWMVAKGQEPGLDLRLLAMQELREPMPLDLHSSDPARISDWLRRQTGVEIAIPERSGARLEGARVIQKDGARIAAVSYRVGDDTTATLLVARSVSSADAGHGHAMWQAQGLTYALASSNLKHPETACLLCHTSL
jgi:hypothetical protein